MGDMHWRHKFMIIVWLFGGREGARNRQKEKSLRRLSGVRVMLIYSGKTVDETKKSDKFIFLDFSAGSF